jgi:hypothetical protein
MDRRLISTLTLMAVGLTFHQRSFAPNRPPSEGAALVQEASKRGAPETSPRSQHEAKAGCGIGDSCDALIPYRETGPWKASCDWFGSTTEQPRGESVPLLEGAAKAVERDQFCLPDDPPELRFLIVTLPDPVTTHLALYFDREIETVEAALRQHEFYLDRYWMPWSLTGTAPAAGDTSQDVRVNKILEAFRLSQPGLMVFTKGCAGRAPPAGSAPCGTTMFVFLVSESPISGINKTQFKNALDYECILSKEPACLTPRPVKIVGPFFSGSVQSVKDLDKNPRHAGQTLDFVSGTMTGKNQAKEMQEEQRIKFRQTQHDDSSAEEFLVQFLEKQALTRDGRDVAILQENETAYGAQPIGGPWAAAPASSKIRRITFPRELSRLRNATPDSFGSQPSVPGQAVTLPAQGLPWNWKDTSKDEDAVPAFSGQQEPLSQQAVLLSIADIIRREDIKYVGIAATDIFDILFLSQFLKIAAPNTRLFLFDADLLMLGTNDEGRDLAGTLVVTTYPLFARNSYWSAPVLVPREDAPQSAQVDVFPSRMIAGIFNAVSLQSVDESDGELGLREYANPFEISVQKQRPPLWLTMVGRTGFWPVSLSPNGCSDPLAKDSVGAPEPVPCPATACGVRGLSFDPPDGATLFLQGCLLLWGGFHLLAIWFGSKLHIAILGQFEAPSNLRRRAQFQAFYLVCASLALSSMLIVIVISIIRLRLAGEIAFVHPSSWFMFYLTMALVGVALLLTSGWIARRNLSTEVPSRFFWFPWALFFATIVSWAWVNWDGAEGLFFAQRAIYLTDGVSPLVPIELFLLVYYLWAWIFIRKVRLSVAKHVLVPSPELLGPGGAQLDDCIGELRVATDHLSFNDRLVLVTATGFVVTIMFLLRPASALRSVEGWIYDTFFICLVLIICLLIALAWARFMYMWNRLRQILRGLERTPLRRAFSRLPKKYAWSPLWYQDSDRRAYTISARSVECYLALVQCPDQSGASQQIADDMLKAYERVVRTDALDVTYDERAGAVADLQRLFLQAAKELLENGLQRRWATQGGSDTLEKLSKRGLAKDAQRTESHFSLIAEEFVALRYVGLIHYESAQMKNLVVLLSAAFILALASIGSYPFLAGRECVWSFAAVFVVFGAGVVMSFAQMTRDAILSRLGSTDPGKLDWSFFLRVVYYGALPLLALLAYQFPSAGRVLFSWLEPTLNALH